ncbi:hypothetical protein K438DRAFT_1960414 [Mycena galopus ATCC 62051]|nr:hypothetical protein K438DRAFT_1960414 [Mycena galopus ATCC 62051]
MHAQGINSPTFTPVPLEGSLTLPQLLDRQFTQSPNHTAYIYDAPDGMIVSISFAQYIGTVYAACRRVLHDTVPHTPVVVSGTGIVIGIFAAADSISYCMMVAAIMRAGLVPFNISPRNSAAGVADLLKKTDAIAVYVSADLKGILADALEIYGKPLPTFDALSFAELQNDFKEEPAELSEPLPVLPAVVDMNSLALILHSSGSTSTVSKPIREDLTILYLSRSHLITGGCNPDVSHQALLQCASDPLSGPVDLCGQILGCHTMPNFHGMGLALGSWHFATGLILAVLRPTTPPIPITPKNALSGILATKPHMVMCSPAAIESWSKDPVGVKAMQALKALAYSGAPLTKRVGDTLVASGVVLCSNYASMETGLLVPFFASHGKDWEYFSMRKEAGAVRVPEEDGSGLYTHTYLGSPSHAMIRTNVEVGGQPGCHVSDLLEQHPDNPDLQRLYARKDELIAFSTGAKMNPVPIEAQINANLLVDAAVVFGVGKPHPGVLIQVKPEFQADFLGDGKKSGVCDTLWVSVEAANKTSPIHFQISRKMVLLADPRKPFALTSKSQPRRRVVFDDYEDEIRAAYLEGTS